MKETVRVTAWGDALQTDSGNIIEGVTASLCLDRETSCNSGFRALNSSAHDSLRYKKKVLMTAREEAGQMAELKMLPAKMPSMEETITVTKHGLILTSVMTVNH